MKIDDYNSILSVSGAGASPSAQSGKSASDDQVSFADQLSQVLAKALVEATSTQSKIDGKEKTPEELLEDLNKELLNKDGLITSINNKVAMSEIDGPGAALPPKESVSALEDLLAMLEEYEAALADPRTSLKDMGPLVASMQEKAQQLEGSLERMDSGLAALANQIIGQAQIEGIKFQRGDYV